MTDATTMPLVGDRTIEVTKVKKDDRPDFFYDDSNDFDRPVVIRGTNKTFLPNPDLQVFEREQDKRLAELIAGTKVVDSDLRMDSHPLDALEIVQSVGDYTVMQHTESGDYYCFNNPEVGKVLDPFQSFCKLLGVPAGWAKKNPSSLNHSILSHWQKAKTSEHTMYIEILHRNTPKEITVNGKKINAKPVVIFHKCKKDGDDSFVIFDHSHQRFPMFSNILTGLVEELEANNLGVTLESYTAGYTGANKGRHFARLLIQHPDGGTDFTYMNGEKEETVKLGLYIETDFLGKTKDFGTVNIGFSFFRLICSNGMTIQLSGEEREEIMKRWVDDQMSHIDTSDMEEHQVNQIRYQRQGEFASIYQTALHIPVAIANHMKDFSLLRIALQHSMEALGAKVKRVEDSIKPILEETTHEEIAETLMACANQVGIQSQNLIKWTCIQIMAEGMGKKEDRTLHSPFDIVNFMTLVARSYNTKVMTEMEDRAMLLLSALTSILLSGESRRINRRLRKYREAVKPDLL